MSFKVTENVSWVGKIDWELRKFHGEELSTSRGSSYNSYLIFDKEIALIDTVWQPFANEFISNLKKIVDLNKIKYIIANHAEVDHSGALPALLDEIPGTPIYCSKNGLKSFKGYYHKDWNFVEVKTGDQLNLGERTLTFIEARMLHWPDSMFCYLDKENILFSNDGFGQHFASEKMFNDLVDDCDLYSEAIKYYANILCPFSPLVVKKIQEILDLKLPVDMICPSHGVIWREKPLQIVEKYMEWANAYAENQITLIYDSMWNSTRIMAEAISEGIKETDPKITVKLFNSSKSDINDIITEVFKSKAILVGSSTVNKGFLSSTASLLEHIRGLAFKGKKAASFGSYGWSGEAVKLLNNHLAESGFDVIHDGIKVLWNPDEDGLGRCMAFGKEITSLVSE